MSTQTTTVAGRPLVAGHAQGRILPLRGPLNLWSGLDPVTGTIVDRGHPDEGATVTGTVLVIPALSGATGGASLAESLRRGTGPAGLVVTAADPSLVLAVAVARELYEVRCPLVRVAAADLPVLLADADARITLEGTVEVRRSDIAAAPALGPGRAG